MRDEIWDDLKAYAKEKRENRYAENVENKESFNKLKITMKEHTPYHWGFFNGDEQKIGDYWPSNNRWLATGKKAAFMPAGRLYRLLKDKYGEKAVSNEKAEKR